MSSAPAKSKQKSGNTPSRDGNPRGIPRWERDTVSEVVGKIGLLSGSSQRLIFERVGAWIANPSGKGQPAPRPDGETPTTTPAKEKVKKETDSSTSNPKKERQWDRPEYDKMPVALWLRENFHNLPNGDESRNQALRQFGSLSSLMNRGIAFHSQKQSWYDKRWKTIEEIFRNTSLKPLDFFKKGVDTPHDEAFRHLPKDIMDQSGIDIPLWESLVQQFTPPQGGVEPSMQLATEAISDYALKSPFSALSSPSSSKARRIQGGDSSNKKTKT